MQHKASRDRGARSASDFAPAADASNLQIVIPHRTSQLTRAALKYAATFANDLNVRVRLIDVHVVPWGVPLEEPTVNPKYLARRIRNLAQESTLPVSAEVVYARDWEQGFRRSLSPGSLVLMAIQRSWWRTSDKRLAARLRKLGHQVIWVECAS
jgi:nucleotide-binding universal stress UspA family protein